MIFGVGRRRTMSRGDVRRGHVAMVFDAKSELIEDAAAALRRSRIAVRLMREFQRINISIYVDILANSAEASGCSYCPRKGTSNSAMRAGVTEGDCRLLRENSESAGLNGRSGRGAPIPGRERHTLQATSPWFCSQDAECAMIFRKNIHFCATEGNRRVTIRSTSSVNAWADDAQRHIEISGP